MNHIAISITEGRTVRDLFCNGLLDSFLEAGYSVTVFTEAVTVPDFLRQWQKPGVEFVELYPSDSTKSRNRAFFIRRRLARLGNRQLLLAWLAWEESRLNRPPEKYLRWFQQNNPRLLLVTHAHLLREAELISAAHKSGIPTLGVVRSWDNVHKGIRSRPQHLAVWNEVNYQEVVQFEGYEPDRVKIIGSPQFDPYFDPTAAWSRQQLATHFNLDPVRPIILFASVGYFIPGFDETCWMDVLLNLVDNDLLAGKPQIICRLHPWSRLEHFQRYSCHPDVRLSYVDRYWPTLTWHMTREDVVEVGNMLRHADLVITPGSTITLEAAIFDRPSVVPVFHPYQPERARKYFDKWVFGKHFQRIKALDLVPIVEQQDQFSGVINRCLQEPAWYREQRQQLVRDYVHFTDGRSTTRLAELALQLIDDHQVK